MGNYGKLKILIFAKRMNTQFNTKTAIVAKNSTVTIKTQSLPICKAGHSCKYKESPTHKAVHPQEGQIVVKEAFPKEFATEYIITLPRSGKCPEGNICGRYHMVGSNKIYNCYHDYICHVPCKDGIKCVKRLKCGYFHPEEHMWEFYRLNAKDVIEQQRLMIEMEIKQHNDALIEKFRTELEFLNQLEEPMEVPMEVPKKTVHDRVSKPKVTTSKTESMRVELSKEALNYLLVEIVKEVGGLKAKVIGEIACIGNAKSKKVEVVPESFVKSDYVDNLLYIQTISVPDIRGDKDRKMKYLTKNAIGRRFIAQFGATDQKCELLDVIQYKVVINVNDNDCFELSEDAKLEFTEDVATEQKMEPETIDEL